MEQQKLFKPPHSFCFDTSAFIHLRDRYPFDVFEIVWAELEKLIKADCIAAPEEVLDELSIYDDDIFRWAKKHSDVFKSLDEMQIRATKAILKDHPLLHDERKEKFDADPFVVAYAQVTKSKIVCVERHKTRDEKRPRIPDVCDQLGVAHLDLGGFIREVGWHFKA